MDNEHSLVAYSNQVQVYSAKLLILIRIVIVLLAINLWTLVNSKINNQSKHIIFCNVISPSGYHDVLLYHMWELWHSSPDVIQKMCLPLLLEALTHFPWTQTM